LVPVLEYISKPTTAVANSRAVARHAPMRITHVGPGSS
jgi:hypothetical protein